FFSFHIYSSKPDKIAMQPVIAREFLNSFGYYDTETILNEWNYIRNWMPHEQFHYTVKVISSLKGAAFIGATMLACQKSPLDHLMYYDASLTAVFIGLFDHITGEPLKPYHALYDFSRLYLLGNEVSCTSDTDSVYTGAAISDDRSKAVIMLTRYQDLENIDGLEPEPDAPTVRIDWSGFTSDTGVRVTYQFLDCYHNNDVCTEETFLGTTGAHLFRMPLYTTILITLEKLQ
ncbi:MAG: hypothetical protein J6S76_07350, partial [Clostridia bacterium]|nr:hypothetical protein [Clostridia bacterium]